MTTYEAKLIRDAARREALEEAAAIAWNRLNVCVESRGVGGLGANYGTWIPRETEARLIFDEIAGRLGTDAFELLQAGKIHARSV